MVAVTMACIDCGRGVAAAAAAGMAIANVGDGRLTTVTSDDYNENCIILTLTEYQNLVFDNFAAASLAIARPQHRRSSQPNVECYTRSGVWRQPNVEDA